jgi:plastocyanin domain-containing protein
MTKNNKKIIMGGAGGIVILLLILSFSNFSIASGNNAITGNVVSAGEVQEVTLKMVNYGYIVEPSELKKDVPVRMEVDMSTVYGCMRDVVIPAFGVKKYVSVDDNIIEFTPTKAGTINIACSMNMGRGTFTVLDSTGMTSNYVDQTVPEVSGGSCAGSSGSASGCGCGGA